jgi:hypothetical protein
LAAAGVPDAGRAGRAAGSKSKGPQVRAFRFLFSLLYIKEVTMSSRSQIVPLVFAVLAGFAGGILSQQLIRPVQAASGGVVTARDFRLVDASGKLLAELAPVRYPKAKAATTELTIYGTNHFQTALGANGLYFGRGWGDEDLGVGYAYGPSHKLGAAVFFWYKKQGRMGMQLDADKGGAPSAWMYDAKGTTIWAAPTPTPAP